MDQAGLRRRRCDDGSHRLFGTSLGGRAAPRRDGRRVANAGRAAFVRLDSWRLTFIRGRLSFILATGQWSLTRLIAFVISVQVAVNAFYPSCVNSTSPDSHTPSMLRSAFSGFSRVLARLRWVAAALLVVMPGAARAQVGSTTDIVQGVVTDVNGRPLEGATIEVFSLETQITRRARTNNQGRYTVLFPDGGGQYRVTIRFLGMAPSVLTIARQSDEDRLVASAKMSQTPTQIQGVVVRAPQGGRGGDPNDRPTPGSQERALSPDQLARLPIDPSDLAQLALLAPGVVGLTGTDSTAAAFSVGGLRPTANNTTVDGLSFGGGSVPQDAVRSTRVITNSYDVARGQFSGGLIAQTTRSGSNVPQGTFNYSLRNRDLVWDPNDPSSFNNAFTQNQLSGGLGGPVVKDKLFVFASAQGRRRADLVPTLLSADPATLARYGASSDSVSRFLSLLNGQGIPVSFAATDNDRLNDNISSLVRFDYLMTGEHTLTLRGDFHWTGQDPTRVGALSLPQTGGTSNGNGGGAMIVLSSNFSGRFVNELRGYAATDRRHSDAFIVLPQGRVLVSSDLPAAARGISTLSFGGNPGLPQRSVTDNLEVSNELSWLSTGGGHRVKLGALFSGARFNQDVTTNRLGTYTFNSMDDFQAGVPATYTRTLAPTVRDGTTLNEALYLGDTYRHSRGLQLVYGARLETSTFRGAPANNADVESKFGFRTDQIPTDTHLSPRVGFTWTLGGTNRGEPPVVILRGGVGEFRSPVPSSLFSAAQGASGLSASESQLVCIGPAVPAPDWAEFFTNPAAIPTTCSAAGQSTPIGANPNVTVFEQTFGAPRAWRASFGFQRRLMTLFNLQMDVNYSRGVNQYGFRDLNLVGTPKFTLGSEDNRPVYADPLSIIPQTGAVSLAGSRIHPEYGEVIAVNSRLGSEAKQFTVQFGGVTSHGAVLNLSYTLARSRDQSSFSCCSATQGYASATTGSDPNVREWSTSDFQRRHVITSTVTYPFSQAMELTAIGRLTSGSPFTPTVSSDVNGDGARNDRAFIFDPGTAPDTAIANGMSRLLAAAPSNVQDCLRAQIGQVASRNSCTGPWQPSVDFQFNYRPGFFGLDRRLAMSLVTVNFLGGLDQLLHGAENLQGWGTSRQQDPTLLVVRGFDPTTERFKYQVNERFGTTRSSTSIITAPFQVGIQARYTLGPDRQRDFIRGLIGGGGGRGGRGGGGGGGGGGRGDGTGGPAGLAGRIERLPNPISQIIARKDSIGLNDDQITRLTPLRDSLDAKNQKLGEEVKAVLDKAGANPDMGALMGSFRPRLDESRKASEHALDEAKKILTSEQWAKLPDRIKNPNRGFGPGTPGGGRAGRPGA
jgi:hypothetical protein